MLGSHLFHFLTFLLSTLNLWITLTRSSSSSPHLMTQPMLRHIIAVICHPKVRPDVSFSILPFGCDPTLNCRVVQTFSIPFISQARNVINKFTHHVESLDKTHFNNVGNMFQTLKILLLSTFRLDIHKHLLTVSADSKKWWLTGQSWPLVTAQWLITHFHCPAVASGHFLPPTTAFLVVLIVNMNDFPTTLCWRQFEMNFFMSSSSYCHFSVILMDHFSSWRKTLSSGQFQLLIDLFQVNIHCW